MNRLSEFLMGAIALLIVSMPAGAVYNATFVGTVDYVQQMGAGLGFTQGTITFSLANQPTLCSSGYRGFSISEATVTDAQTRKNMLAILLLAKASGARVQVAYDSNGGYCDQGMPAVYYLDIL